MSDDTNVHPLVKRIAGLDRAGLATLRRSLAFPAGTWPQAFPFVEPFVATTTPWRRTVAYLVAGLMAWSRSEAQGDGDMGDACARFASASESGSVERRFLDLLDADPEALPHRLRQLVALMASKGVVPSWSRLLHDLAHWSHPERVVQQRWARSFYTAVHSEPADDVELEITDAVGGPTAADADA